MMPATVAYPIGYILSQLYSISPGKIGNIVIPNNTVQNQYKNIILYVKAIVRSPKTIKLKAYSILRMSLYFFVFLTSIKLCLLMIPDIIAPNSPEITEIPVDMPASF